jgi:hypothetical protein
MAEAVALISLDIDGVLRRIGSPHDVLDADCLGRFEAVLRAHPAARIVISSSWRLVYGLDAIRARFAPDIGARIIGHTPWLEDRRQASRADEVLAYLASVDEMPRWVALDDQPGVYADRGLADCVIPLDGATGFDAVAAAQLGALLGRQA